MEKNPKSATTKKARGSSDGAFNVTSLPLAAAVEYTRNAARDIRVGKAAMSNHRRFALWVAWTDKYMPGPCAQRSDMEFDEYADRCLEAFTVGLDEAICAARNSATVAAHCA